jgi:hypothetical protein
MPTDDEGTGQSPAAAATQPAAVSAARSRLRQAFDFVAQLVIPLSVGCYLVGFLVAMPHLSRSGVPLQAISPQTFLAAGLLFMALSGAGAACGYAAREITARIKERPAAISWGIAIATLTPLGIASAISSGLAGRIHAIGVALAFWLYPRYYTMSVDTERPWWSAWDATRLLLVALGLIASFGQAVYPIVPVEFGGGRPRPIVQYTIRDAPIRLATQDQWATTGCRSVSATPPACRAFYRVYETSEHVYMAVVDNSGPCNAALQPWATAFGRKPRIACYQRIANAALQTLELPGE